MIRLMLTNGTSAVVQINDIKRIVSFGEKTLVYFSSLESPLIVSASLGAVCKIIDEKKKIYNI